MDDENILELFFARSEEAISRIAEKYGRLCEKVAYNILLNKEDAEECVNTGYHKLWNAIPPQRPASLCGYLCAVVRNTALSVYDKVRQRSCEVLYEELDELIPSEKSLEEQFDSGHMAALINEFLVTANKRSREIFTARYYFNFSISEIAHSFDMSETAVKSRLSRTRAELKKYLSERGVTV